MQFISTGIHAQEMKVDIHNPKTEHTCTKCIIQVWLPSDNLSCAFQDGVKI